jgi:hypothetical protein
MIKKIFFVLTTALFVAVASSGSAQSMTDTLTWSVDKLTDLKTNNSFDYSCTFKTKGNNDITWIQGKGTVINTLKVSHVDGTWADVSQAGSITYSISLGEKSGTIRFERTDDSVSITIDFTSTDGLKHSYHVSAIQSN